MATKARAKAKARNKAKSRALTAEATDEVTAPTRSAGSGGGVKADRAAKGGSRRAQRKGRLGGGRATPAGTGSPRSGRHTPPVPKNVKSSPRWMGFAIIATFVIGALVVVLDYAGLLPGGVNNAWLLAAIAAIFAGLLLATRYH